MLRGFLVFVFFAASLFYAWDQGVTHGGLGRYIERHPTLYQGDTVLYGLASFHEVWNQDQNALDMYQRLVAVYPDSRWGDEAQFGVASSYERLRDRKKALAEYEKYLEKYPRGRYHKSVSNNIYLLRGL
jgi:tetratricopeptide (TPR) repeat protein